MKTTSYDRGGVTQLQQYYEERGRAEFTGDSMTYRESEVT